MRELAGTPMRLLLQVGAEEEISTVRGEREGHEIFRLFHALDRLRATRIATLEGIERSKRSVPTA